MADPIAIRGDDGCSLCGHPEGDRRACPRREALERRLDSLLGTLDELERESGRARVAWRRAPVLVALTRRARRELLALLVRDDEPASTRRAGAAS